MRRKVTILGDGGWGTTIAVLLSKKGCDVTLWGAFPGHIETLKKERVNRKFLPGIPLPGEIRFISRADEIDTEALAVVAIPSKYLRETIAQFKGSIGKKVVSLTKGIETETLKRPSEILRETLGDIRVAVLSGPSISVEVARDFPTTVVAASGDEGLAREVQEVMAGTSFRVYTTDDVVGVELGGALKNIIAIAAGISDGMGFGANTKAAILTRGLVEIVRLSVKTGGRKETVFGLSGLGDLATTCMSSHSRNRWLGEEIGKGKKINDVLGQTEMVVEGVTTTRSAHALAQRLNVEMPITEKIYQVLYGGKRPKDAVKELMTRTPKPEAV
jgi:glycerol-3-phosphate dehydrogenase (NAD(P)+)